MTALKQRNQATAPKDKLRERLESAGVLQAGQFEAAEVYADEKGFSVTRALVELRYTDQAVLGRHLSEVHGLPYISLETPSALEARSRISLACAKKWQVLPVQFDAQKNCLTLAVHDGSQADHMQKIHRLLMLSHGLDFCIASESEIDSAFKTHFSPDSAEAYSRESRPSALSSDSRSAQRATTGQTTYPVAQAAVPHAYPEMSRALVDCVSMWVQEKYRADSTLLKRVRSRVRYGQLIATRLKFPPTTSDSVILAAWLSAFDGDLSADLTQITIPYPIASIFDQVSDGAHAEHVEAKVLALLRAYEDAQADRSQSGTDIGSVRRALLRTWGTDPNGDGLLETFLQILMDEDFLSRADGGAGRILIIDPAESSDKPLTSTLVRDGYDVRSAAGAANARSIMEDYSVDLVICENSLPDSDGLTVCREFKSDTRTTAIPFVLISSHGDEEMAAQALRAGADDYVRKPVNLELLYLKMQRLLDATGTRASSDGVQGTLDDMSFTDLIQILCAGGRSARIELTRDGSEASVYIQEGSVTHVTCAGEEGEAAFYELMRWTDGSFNTQTCGDFPERTIHVPAMSLLMEGARIHDEASGS